VFLYKTETPWGSISHQDGFYSDAQVILAKICRAWKLYEVSIPSSVSSHMIVYYMIELRDMYISLQLPNTVILSIIKYFWKQNNFLKNGYPVRKCKICVLKERLW
jgi:hypothetical protein